MCYQLLKAKVKRSLSVLLRVQQGQDKMGRREADEIGSSEVKYTMLYSGLLLNSDVLVDGLGCEQMVANQTWRECSLAF